MFNIRAALQGKFRYVLAVVVNNHPAFNQAVQHELGRAVIYVMPSVVRVVNLLAYFARFDA